MKNKYRLFKTKMKQYKITARSSTLSHAFASALAPADVYDEARIVAAMVQLGQDETSDLQCVYCNSKATTIDHLNGLVQGSKFTGHGHVIGNLVPACNDCNTSKGGKDWREFCKTNGVPLEQIDRLAEYEKLAPTPTSEEQLRELYPDLMAAYQRMRDLSHELLKTADNLANEIHRLEARRLARQFE